MKRRAVIYGDEGGNDLDWIMTPSRELAAHGRLPRKSNESAPFARLANMRPNEATAAMISASAFG